MRLLTIALAYALSAIIGALLLVFLLTAVSVYQSPVRDGVSLAELRFAMVFTLGGAIVALPIAAPFIIFSELRKIGSPLFFLLAGAAAGLLMVVLFVDLHELTGRTLIDSILIICSGALAALTYWLVAWRFRSPLPRSIQKPEGQL